MRQLKISQQITMRESISLVKYLNEISLIPLLTKEEEQELPALIQAGDEKAFNRFVNGNLRFVISVAKQYQGSGGDRLDDLINAGNEGLMIAARKFDTTKGFKFISYAVWWIRQSIMQHLTENVKIIRLPSNKVAIVNKIKNITSSLEQKLQRTPTVEEIGDEMMKIEKIKAQKADRSETKFDINDIDEIIAISSPISSLDMKVGEDSDASLVDLIVADGIEDIRQKLNQQDLELVLRNILTKKLTQREREIIISNFGLFGLAQKNLEEIGFEQDLTKERVRQIREKALRKLTFKSHMLKEYIS